MHSYHFYGPDGILRYATRILRPAVAPLRALPSNEADKSDSSRNTSIVPLPPLRSLLPTLSSPSKLPIKITNKSSHPQSPLLDID